MPWDTTELSGLTEALASESPFVTTAPREPSFAAENPLAASTAFAARTVFAPPEPEAESYTQPEMEDEEVVDALPGYTLEESLRSVHDGGESEEGEGFESAAA